MLEAKEGFEMIPRELSSEEEEELIEKISTTIVKSGFGTVALLYLESYKPLSFVGGQIALFYLSPILPLLGKWGQTGTDLVMLISKKENVDKIINRIKELMQEEEKKKEKEKRGEK
ncbi:MAG: hypothetical protein DRO00_06310 [Thermoproteota archaeon]|nr:MAG: hypothetical protein DRO00_06310 [Candidatus Korarchaeota archaeon]